jgi:hypothetical protein
MRTLLPIYALFTPLMVLTVGGLFVLWVTRVLAQLAQNRPLTIGKSKP